MNDKKRAAMDTIIEKIKCAHELLENMDHDALARAVLDSPTISGYYDGKFQQELQAAQKLCAIYFKIASDALGEDAVREKRNKAILRD